MTVVAGASILLPFTDAPLRPTSSYAILSECGAVYRNGSSFGAAQAMTDFTSPSPANG